MSIKKLGKKSACLMVGASLLIGGGCIPNNFWADTWGWTLRSATDAVVGTALDLYVVTPMQEAIVEAGATE